MWDRTMLRYLLQGLTIFLLGVTCGASSLGAVVHVVPLQATEGKTVRAHFSVIVSNPCPDLSDVCATGEDCEVHLTSLPFTGTKPGTGWCVRQWQKTIPSNYNATVNLGSKEEFYVSVKAGPKVRSNNGRLNQPPYVALTPPLRARVNCPEYFYLSVKDLDRDKVQCRFARADQGECLNCTQHSFLELDKEKCVLAFNGAVSAGRFSVVVMVEDFIPTNRIKDVKPLSSIPVHLSLTVEEGSSSCSAAPVPSGQTPREGTMLYILPYMQTDITVSFVSELESVSEIAVVGPPDLFRSGLITNGSITTMMTAWVRDLNKLAPLLPICFAANTNSLQSHSRCVWLFQLEMKTLPAGTELRCEKTEMTLLLPLATLENVNLAELKLNSPTCPVNYNNTHLTARIPLTGCGTKQVHSGSELIYTNTLKSVRPYTKVSRLPSLVLPLACRIPGLKATGPKYKIAMPQEKEFFGNFTLWLETHMPGEGPFSEFTRIPRFHKLHSFLPGHIQRKAMPALSVDSPRFFSGSTGSSSNKLDLHVMSSCHVRRAELFIGNCMESETEDFADPHPILENGCMASNSTLEVILVTSTARVYRIDLSGINAKGSKMFLECTVYLCISTMPSKKCPDPCAASHSSRMLTENIFSRTYTVQSEAIVLEVNNVTPKPTAVITTAATHQVMNANTATPAVTATTTTTTATSNAPEEASAMSMAVILTVICISL